MEFELGKQRDMLKEKVKSVGEEKATAWFMEGIENGKIAVEDVSIKDMYEAMHSTSFPKAVGALIHKKIIDAYMETPAIGDQLVTTVPSTRKTETIVGFTAAEQPEQVNEGMPYEDSSIGEKFVTIDNYKYGRTISITEETVMFDQTGQIINRSQDIGEKARLYKERKIVRGVVGLDAVYKPQGVSTTFYSATHKNLSTSSAFGEAGLEKMRILQKDMTDEQGDPILINPGRQILIVPTELELEAWQMMNSTLTPESAENASNFFKSKYTTLSSPFLTSTTDWWLGDFRRNFWWTEVYPLQVLRHKEPSEANWERDIIAQFKVRFYGGLGAIEHRHAFKATA